MAPAPRERRPCLGNEAEPSRTSTQGPPVPASMPCAIACEVFYFFFSTRLAATTLLAWRMPLTSTRSPFFSEPHALSNLVLALVETVEPETENVIAGQAPPSPPIAPSSRASPPWRSSSLSLSSSSSSSSSSAVLFSTRLASTMPFACLTPSTSTWTPFWSVVHAPSSKVVAALVITVEVPTLKVIDGHAPVRAAITPFSSTRPGSLGLGFDPGVGFGFVGVGFGAGLLLLLSLPGTGELCVVVAVDDDGVDGVDMSAPAAISTGAPTKNEMLWRIA